MARTATTAVGEGPRGRTEGLARVRGRARIGLTTCVTRQDDLRRGGIRVPLLLLLRHGRR